jgi:hypothetical protein
VDFVTKLLFEGVAKLVLMVDRALWCLMMLVGKVYIESKSVHIRLSSDWLNNAV